MCGIAGILRTDGPLDTTDLAVLPRMAAKLAHRGPDDEGFALIARRSGVIDVFAGDATVRPLAERLPPVAAARPAQGADLGIAHRRFSIIDPTPAAHQPFVAPQGDLCLAYNGEIYNYIELREELGRLGHRFRTRSDAEVFLTAYREWGRACFERLNGMWAAAIHDVRTGELVLSRDRLGKRPLYLLHAGGRMLFASEIKALRCHPAATCQDVRRDRVAAYLLHGVRDLDDGTFFDGVDSLPAGTCLVVAPDGATRVERYWTLPARDLDGRCPAPDDAAEELRSLLASAVALRMRSDVPVAFELSGGMDSSSIVALASVDARRPTSYTIRSDDPAFDESDYARRVAVRYALDHRVLTPNLDRFWEEADTFILLQEEPFHSVNLHTNQWLRRRIRDDGFRVLISGAAGDELFAGYHEYLWAYRRTLADSGGSTARAERAWIAARHIVPPMLRGAARSLAGRRAFLPAQADRIRAVLAPDLLNGAAAPPQEPRLDALLRGNLLSLKLPYWLRSGDKANMGIPIEPRVPFLDYRVVEFAFRLPLHLLIRRGWTKWILRTAMKPLLPRRVVWRRDKMGFPVPLQAWLTGNRERLIRVMEAMDNPYVPRAPMLGAMDDLLARAPEFVWRVLSLELWHRVWIRGEPALPPAAAAPKPTVAGAGS